MANVLTNKTIHIDTTMVSGYQAGRGLGGNVNPLRITGAKLLGGSVASTAVITDPVSSKVLATFSAPIAGTDSLNLATPVRWRDFLVTITGAGAVLEIYQG